MRLWLKKALGGTVGLVGLAAIAVPDLRAELYFDGGFVYRTEPGDQARGNAPRYGYPPPMEFGFSSSASVYPTASFAYPGGVGRYRFSSPRSYDSGVPPSFAPPAATPAGRPDHGVRAADPPWNQVSFAGYEGSTTAPVDAPVGLAKKDALEAGALPQRVPAEQGSVVVLVAHLPEDAALWVEGVLTRAKGRTRYFESPPLPSGKRYRYAVTAVWREDGRWVTQTREVAVRAGEVHGVYLRTSASRRLPPTR